MISAYQVPEFWLPKMFDVMEIYADVVIIIITKKIKDGKNGSSESGK